METITVTPTADGLGYAVRLAAHGFAVTASVSSMHLVEDKLPQLRRMIDQLATEALEPQE